MKSRFLFPNNWRTPGAVIFIIGLFFNVITQLNSGPIDDWATSHPLIFGINAGILTNDIEYLLLVSGLLLFGFSKEKIEDEQLAQLRSDSLQWAIYVNYGILLVCIIFINGIPFLLVICYNVLSPLLFFIVRFRWKIYQINRLLKLEEAVS